eukprot:gene4133-5887_t
MSFDMKKVLIKNSRTLYMDTIDPLDNLKENKNIPLRYTQTPFTTIDNKSLIDNEQQKNSFVSTPTNSYNNSIIYIDVESKMLQNLPIFLLNTFKTTFSELIPRISLIILTIHVMLLIPLLPFIKFKLGTSIIPFIYIGPVLFSLPFFTFWIWENNWYPLPIIDLRLQRFIESQAKLAQQKEQIETKGWDELLESKELLLSEEEDMERVNSIAYVKLMAKIDVSSMIDEVMYIKENPELFKKYEKENFMKLKSSPNPNTIDAINALLSSEVTNGLTKEEILQQLKDLQNNIEKWKE